MEDIAGSKQKADNEGLSVWPCDVSWGMPCWSPPIHDMQVQVVAGGAAAPYRQPSRFFPASMGPTGKIMQITSQH